MFCAVLLQEICFNKIKQVLTEHHAVSLVALRKRLSASLRSVLAPFPLVPCPRRRTFAAELLNFPWKVPCVNIYQDGFTGSAEEISHVRTTWHYKEFAEEVVLWMKAEMLLGKLLLLSYIMRLFLANLFLSSSVSSSLLLIPSWMLFSGFTEMTIKKKTALFCIKYQEHCRQNGIVQKQLPCPIVSF